MSTRISVKSAWTRARSSKHGHHREQAVRTRRRGFIAVLAAAAVGATSVLGIVWAGAASASTSGASWPSGAWLANDSPSVAAQFGTWRGTPMKVVERVLEYLILE